MEPTRTLTLITALLLAPLAALHAADTPQPAQPQRPTIYVAPGGKDAAAGTQAAPLATLAGARDRVRQLKQEGAAGKPISVVFADGTYELAEAVVFGPQDSGAKKAPVTYRAEHPGKVILSGGSHVTGWTPKGEGVWAAPIESGRDFYQLFVNGERRQRARTPNSGYLKSFGPARPVANFGALKPLKDPPFYKEFRYRDGDLQNWPDLADALVIFYHSWLVSVHWVDRIDPAKGIAIMRNPAGWPFGNVDNQQERYVIENIKSAFDAPGEWYLDKAAGELLYRPLPGEDMKKPEVTAPVALRLLELDNVEHLAFEGLAFRYSDWRLDKDAFRDQQAFANLDCAPIFGRKLRHTRFENCEIALAGIHALVLREGCQNNVISQCHIHNMAGGGVYIGVLNFRPGTPPAELSHHNTVNNCFIHTLNHTFHGAVGILLGQASDNTITHNDISEFDWTGISVGWNWVKTTNSYHRNNRIEKNHIHHLMQGVLSDGGGIYFCGYLHTGTVVRGNVVHDINHHLTHCSAKGFYLDNPSSDLVVENNLCYDISSLGIQAKGERNQIRNNIFAYCGVAGLSRGTETGIPDEVNQFSRNILYMEHPVMARGAVSSALSTFDHQLYWNRRPPLNAVFIDGSIDGDGTRASDESEATGRKLGQAELSVVADPGFVNPEQRDFRLKPGSPAEKIGFVPFDFSDAGLYGDPAWTARPATLTHRPLETVEPDWLAFRYDFEDHRAGMMPMTCWSVGEKNGCTVRISTDRAASGTKSLLFEDGADAPSYFPMLSIKRGYADGRYRLSLKLWQDPANPAELSLGTRSYMGATCLTGVRVRIGPDGAVFAGDKKLGTVPQGEWITLELSFGSGAEHAASYDVSATLTNGARLEATQVPVADATFQQLNWIGVIASGTKGRLYIDDLGLSVGTAIQKATLPQTK
jgi:hypothetical protein